MLVCVLNRVVSCRNGILCCAGLVTLFLHSSALNHVRKSVSQNLQVEEEEEEEEEEVAALVKDEDVMKEDSIEEVGSLMVFRDMVKKSLQTFCWGIVWFAVQLL